MRLEQAKRNKELNLQLLLKKIIQSATINMFLGQAYKSVRHWGPRSEQNRHSCCICGAFYLEGGKPEIEQTNKS